jgi:hypothetical protein
MCGLFEAPQDLWGLLPRYSPAVMTDYLGLLESRMDRITLSLWKSFDIKSVKNSTPAKMSPDPPDVQQVLDDARRTRVSCFDGMAAH